MTLRGLTWRDLAALVTLAAFLAAIWLWADILATMAANPPV